MAEIDLDKFRRQLFKAIHPAIAPAKLAAEAEIDRTVLHNFAAGRRPIPEDQLGRLKNAFERLSKEGK